MNSLRVSRCCFVFTPRQGTVVVAIADLCLTSIVLFLLLLAAMNTQEIAAMASAELQALESNWSAEFGDRFNLPLYYLNNEKRMLTGQNLASIMMTLIYDGVVLCVFHILFCLMLLYGAISNLPNLLLPWLLTVLLSIVCASLVLVSFAFFQPHKCTLLVYVTAAVLLLALEIHAWLAVFTYHRELSNKNIYRDIEHIIPTHVIYEDKNRKRVDL